MTILIAIGKRSEVIKTAPIIRELRKRRRSFILVDVQQEKGWFMKGSHYLELNYPKPHYTVKFEGSSVKKLTYNLLDILEDEEPDYVMATGYSKTILAASIAANMVNLPFLHVESGHRTYNLKDEDEIRRQIIDSLSTICYASTKTACSTLLEEGMPGNQVIHTGSTAIDSLVEFLGSARERSQIIEELELNNEEFSIITLRKPENISEEALREVLNAIRSLDEFFVMPLHSEAREALHRLGLYEEFLNTSNILMVEPLDYLDFIALEYSANIVVTDSGTVSEEAAYLSKPLVILGETTRNELVDNGLALRSNLIEKDMVEKIKLAKESRGKSRKSAARILGNGTASEIIAEHVVNSKIVSNPRVKFNYSLGFPSFKVIELDKPLKEIPSFIGMNSCLISAVRNRVLVKDPQEIPEEALIFTPEQT